jgi:membrane protein required for colicin V production
MNGLDWIIVGILFFSVVVAALQGFLYEIFSLAGAILGYLLAAWGYRQVAPWFLPYVKNEWVANSVAFFVIFLAVVLIAGIIARVSRSVMKQVGLRWFDRLLGALFGGIRGAVIVMVVVMSLASFGPGSQALANSRFGWYFLVMGRAAAVAAPYELREQFRRGISAAKEIRSPEPSGRPGAELKPSTKGSKTP